MPRELSSFPTLALLVALGALPAPVLAQTVVVPDDYPTVQAAIDGGAQVIRVRKGLKPERITVHRSVVIEPGPPPMYHPTWTPMPVIQSMEVTNCSDYSCGQQLTIRGVRFLGDVRLAHGSEGFTFESCRLDSGLTDLTGNAIAGSNVSVRNCLILGDTRLVGTVQFVGNTLIGCKAFIFSDGLHEITHNYITGPAEVGLELKLGDSEGLVSWNTIRNVGDGIRILRDGDGKESHNDIANCSGAGILYADLSSMLSAKCDSNLIADCGGAGIEVRPTGAEYSFYTTLSANGNRISRTGQAGVLAPKAFSYSACNNVIFDAGGDGMVFEVAVRVRGNVIGRSRGAGYRCLDWSGSVVGNTFFSNAEAGLDLWTCGPYDSVALNISAFNGDVGFRLRNGWLPRVLMNDWFGNVVGPTGGVAPGITDLDVNPLFCDLGGGNVHLSAGSPLLAVEGADRIGALGEGCGGTTGVGERRPREIGGFSAWPTPAKGPVVFAIPASDQAVELEVYDVTGARRWSTTYEAGTSEARWDGIESSGRRAEPGVYFARIRSAGVDLGRTRIVLTE